MVANSIRKGYVDCDFGQLHYRIAGDSDKPTVVLIHQCPSSSVMYEPLMLRLADHYQLIAPDLPGFGQTDPLPVHGSIALYADAFLQALSALNISRCFLFGHHTGAAVAVQMASDKPKLVKGVALSGPTLLSEQQKRELPLKAKPFVQKESGRHLLNMWQRIRGKDTSAPLDLSLRETLLALQLNEHYLEAYTGVAEHDCATQMAAIKCKTLVFAGTKDILYPCLAPSLALLKKGSKAEIPGAATYVCESHVDEVAALLRDFF